MATGEVELIGTQIGSTGSESGTAADDKTKVIDGDFTTFFSAANASGDWVGIDAGAAVTVTRWKFAPRRGQSGITHDLQYENRLEGGKIQASSASDFSSDVTDCDTVPAPPPTYWSKNWNQRSTTSPPSKRYWRYLGPTSGRCNIAELRFIANAGVSSAKPCAPTISPWGGHYRAGSVTVTLSSLTTSASLYYTTDGTAPDNTDTLYSGPFSLDCSPGLTLKVVAYDASLDTDYSDIVSARFEDYDFAPRDGVYDDRGILVEAHAGGVITEPGGAPKLIGGYYYRYGMAANRYNVVQTWDGNGADGIWCYRSTDLVNWELVGHMLANPNAGEHYTCERPHVLYNAANNNYVMWVHIKRIITAAVQLAAVATASAPGGPWTWGSTNFDPDGRGLRDFNTFVDTDNKGHLVYQANSGSFSIYISELASDYLTTLGTEVEIVALNVEGPALCKIGSTYILGFGDGNYYDSAGTTFNQRYRTSTSLTSGWSTIRNLFTTDPVGSDYNAQLTQLLPFNDGLIFLGDFWLASDIYGSRDVWLPVDDVVIPKTSWNLTRLEAPSNTLLSGLVLYLPLDEMSGNAIDAVGSNDGVATGSPDTRGMRFRSRVLSTGNRFVVPNATALQAGDIDFWISLWVRRTSLGSFDVAFEKDAGGGSGQREYGLYVSNDDKYHFYATADGSTIAEVVGNNRGTVAANDRDHIIVGHSATDNELFMYVNGVAETPTSHSGGIHVGANDLELFGANVWTGDIGNFGIWKRARPTSGEVSALYNDGAGLLFGQFALPGSFRSRIAGGLVITAP